MTVRLTLDEAARLASLLCSLPIVYDPRQELRDAATPAREANTAQS